MSNKPTKAELIAWANEQKRAYRKGELRPSQIKKLESIKGWNWDKPTEAELDQEHEDRMALLRNQQY